MVYGEEGDDAEGGSRAKQQVLSDVYSRHDQKKSSEPYSSIQVQLVGLCK